MITLYRVDDGQNMHRFYHLRVEQTLFGGWAVIREWGRIGNRKGQTLEEWFEAAEPAKAALQKLAAAKRLYRGTVIRQRAALVMLPF